MTIITETCIEPYIDSFMRCFAEANYKPATIKGYRNLIRRLGLAMDEASIAPSALTPDLAEKLGRAAEPQRTGTIRLYSLGRKFGAHLIEIGVAKPVAPTRR
jgi:integrase/recombinase XerD